MLPPVMAGERALEPSSTTALALLAALALAGCSRTELETPCPDRFGRRGLLHCDPAAEEPPATLWADETPRGVLSAGCDLVVVVTRTVTVLDLRVSLDGGWSFSAPRPLPPGIPPENIAWTRFEPLAMAEDGTLHVLVQSDGSLLVRRSDDLGESWGEPVEIARDQNFVVPSLVVRGEEVVASWVEWPIPGPPVGGHLARSLDRGQSFGPPAFLGGVEGSSRPTVCLPGERGVLASWLDCTNKTCSGRGRDGTSLGMAAVSSGGPMITHGLFALDNVVNPPIAGCFDDGRALIAWSTAPNLGDQLGGARDIVVASVLRCGLTVETARFPGGRSRFAGPESPIPTLGRNGALLHWHSSRNAETGVALLDSLGGLVTVRLDPDFDENGAHDVAIAACALPDGGYALLAESPASGQGSVQTLAVILRDDGSTAEVRVLAGEVWEGWVSCDGGGRAHFVWQSGKGGGHASVLVTP
jgi:hypothetical protein